MILGTESEDRLNDWNSRIGHIMQTIAEARLDAHYFAADVETSPGEFGVDVDSIFDVSAEILQADDDLNKALAALRRADQRRRGVK